MIRHSLAVVLAALMIVNVSFAETEEMEEMYESLIVKGSIIELNDATEPREQLATENVDFTIVSFYESENEESQWFQEVFTAAHKLWSEDYMKGYYKEERKLQWAQVNVKEFPGLKFAEEETKYPNQFIIGAHMKKPIAFTKARFGNDNIETVQDYASVFLQIVIDFTGDFTPEIPCDAIDGMVEKNERFIVSFAQPKEFEEGGKLEYYKQMSIYDRYIFDNFNALKVGFYTNTDPECAKERTLDPEVPAIILYVHSQVKPFARRANDEKPWDFESLNFWISLSLTEFSMEWTQRAEGLMFRNQMNAIVYVMDKIDSAEQLENDWRFQLMSKQNNIIREGGFGIINIVVPLEQNMPADMRRLTDLMGIKKEEVPQIYTVHPQSESIVPYPMPLDDPTNFAPEMILLWGRKVVLEIEVPNLEEQYKKSVAAGNVAKEGEEKLTDAAFEEKLQYFADYVKKMQGELEAIKKKEWEFVDQIKRQKNMNKFADEYDAATPPEQRDPKVEHIEL